MFKYIRSLLDNKSLITDMEMLKLKVSDLEKSQARNNAQIESLEYREFDSAKHFRQLSQDVDFLRKSKPAYKPKPKTERV